MRCQDLVCGHRLEKLDRLVLALALEHVQIFNYKLVFFGPPDPKASHVLFKSLLCLS